MSILAPTFLPADPALAARRQNHMRQWAARQRERDAALVADAVVRGVTGLRCDSCGHVHGLGMIGRGCNASHPSIDGATCEGWNLTEVKGGAK